MARIFFMSALDGTVEPIAAHVLQRIQQDHEVQGLVKIVVDHRLQIGKLRKLTPLKILRRIEQLAYYRQKISQRDREIRQLLFSSNDYPDWPTQIEIRSSELNSAATAQRLQELNPDVLLVFGCPLLKPEIFSIARLATVNLHLGISPWYRGEHTIFWPMLRRDYKRIGFTLHHIDSGVDTGEILAHGHPALEPSDTEASIFAKVGRLAGNVITEFLRTPEARGIPQKAFGTKGILFRAGDRHIWHDADLANRHRSDWDRIPTLKERTHLYFAGESVPVPSNSTTAGNASALPQPYAC